MKLTVNFALVGCGVISHVHIAALAAIEDARLSGVFDQYAPAAEALAAKTGTRCYASYDELLADPDVDAVCICTPSGLHAGQAERAVRAGKHVLIEKPIALTLADCDRISAAARARGLKVGVVSQLRFAPAVRQVKKAVEDGLLGRICSADIYMKYYRSQQYYDSGTWRGTLAMDGGGALMNQGIHGVDLLRYVMGPLRSIQALSGTLARDIEVEDTLNAVVEFQCGAYGVIQAMTAAYPGFPRRLELNGECGTIILEEDQIVKWEIEGEPAYREYEQAGERFVESHNDPGKISSIGHSEQLKNFISAVRGDTELLVDDREGRRTLEIILNAYESARCREPVYF